MILAVDSVGGNLCAALCVNIAKMQLPRPKLQILFYPILSNNIDSKSYKWFATGYGLTREWRKNYIYQYTSAEYNDESFSSNELVYPLYANADVFSKTVIVSASCDILLDDALLFAEKLRNNSVDVFQTIEPGPIHGFMTYGRYFATEIDRILLAITNELKAI